MFFTRSIIGSSSCSGVGSMVKRCGVRRIGQVAKLTAARAEVRLTRAFGSGTVGQGRCRRQGRESGLEVAVREQQGRRMKHENGEGEMKRCDMRTANTLSHACARCLYATQRKCVRKMCVWHGVCTPLPSHTQQLPLRGCEILRLKKILRLRRSTSILNSPTKTHGLLTEKIVLR